MDLLVGAAREQGTTVVLVTHEPRVAAYADREVIVRDGRVHALPRPDRLVIRFGLRLAAGRRPRGAHPPGRHRRRRRARRRAAAGHPRRRQRGQRPDHPVRLAELRHRRGDRPDAAPTRCGGRPAQRPLPRQADHPRRRRRDRPGRARSRPGSRACPGPASTTPRPRCASCWPPTPADQLGDRYPGRPVGTIGDAALPSPDSLLVIVGRTPDERRQAAAPRRSRIATRSPATARTAASARHRRHEPHPGRDRRRRCSSRC